MRSDKCLCQEVKLLTAARYTALAVLLLDTRVRCVELDRFGAYVKLLIPIVLVLTSLALLPRSWENMVGISVRQKQRMEYSYLRPTTATYANNTITIKANKTQMKSYLELVSGCKNTRNLSSLGQQQKHPRKRSLVNNKQVRRDF